MTFHHVYDSAGYFPTTQKQRPTDHLLGAACSALISSCASQMKNPVFPSVVLQERMSMLQFLRLSRAGYGHRAHITHAAASALVPFTTRMSCCIS